MYCFNTEVRVDRAGVGRAPGSGRGGEESQDPLRRMEPPELWGREDRGGARGRLGFSPVWVLGT